MLRADLAARRSAGSQLLQNPHIRFSGPSAARLRAGEVDTRLLATLAVLASQYSFRVVRAQDPPYVPAHAAADGQAGLSVEFALPSPLGLLSPVLDAGSPRPGSARGAFR